MKLDIRSFSTTQDDFRKELDALLAWDSVSDAGVQSSVENIVNAVRSRGDEALIEFTNKFDRRTVSVSSELELSRDDLEAASGRVPADVLEALEKAAERVRSYHEKQMEGQRSWQYTEADGTMLGQQVSPLDRVGVYVPGGKAAYPSSVLMNVLPAHVSGVKEIIMVVPTPDGEVNDIVMAAAYIAGVSRVFTVGGAQAVAALAYGTETVPKVDKIVGPGNIYVATAKRMVFGAVGIDMIAGPSEILVVCDGKTDPDWIAMDLFSQAEHDEDAQSILISPDADFIGAVKASMELLIEDQSRKDIIKASLEGRGAFIHVSDMNEAIEIANIVAAEHLELSVESPEEWLPKIRHAGAIFMGRHTPEALGDYCAGPNHVLPTSGTARFSSPLGVYDFQKRSSLIYCSPEGASELGKIASPLARGESLEAHAMSAEYRIKG
ncbi:histidinol dehydrogenase [Marinomonas mediterranea]|jgi:histidinol dehydrogenase (EC 1.1.1.23)|uniref:Histidinol dehydrogenase n=1 Tax=Marinomonas mediterranea (strain ATCC 700492 / JCM 21426 / NBRC 103028 / MMB-1) TaxID=717774 RepID=F2K1B3_MARM1|nr:histidinol dehydrogenase [Marinomonas mediterranea]ADZ91044.1 Histidinol dehydrogenase [Marinomonas mediterranea MMB-1]WCN09081.1 histidinol dehydrogenase [Marinomonas mediterranea]WCN13112.1 histidinol dehydrogenase [Marinomonas mediterranea]WCN17183.1 histidinol dehydrogenase [Marinomonas mediterranea MMB-1]